MLLAGALAVSGLLTANAGDSRSAPVIATVHVSGEFMEIASHVAFDQGVLRIAGPEGYALTLAMPAQASILTTDLVADAELASSTNRLHHRPGLQPKVGATQTVPALADGIYHYEIKLFSNGQLLGTNSGIFQVEDGLAYQPQNNETAPRADEALSQWHAPSLMERALGGVLDLLIAPASAASGDFDDFVSIRNVTASGASRLNLNATDSITVNSDSWRLHNDATNKRFEILEGSGTSRLAITQGGNLGLGTTAPQNILHIDRSGGFQTRLSAGTSHALFDMFGTSFRIGTHNHTNVFRIFDDAPANSLSLQGGNVGLGIPSPDKQLHVQGADPNQLGANNTMARVENNAGTSASRRMLELVNNGSPLLVYHDTSSGEIWSQNPVGGKFTITKGGTGQQEFQMDGGGNVTIQGSLTENSSRSSKEGFAIVDTETVLTKLGKLPIEEWSYRHSPAYRHVGPMAEDFHAAFGLGPGDGIAPRDLAGVALAAAKALKAENDSLKSRIARLEYIESRFRELESEVAALRR